MAGDDRGVGSEFVWSGVSEHSPLCPELRVGNSSPQDPGLRPPWTGHSSAGKALQECPPRSWALLNGGSRVPWAGGRVPSVLDTIKGLGGSWLA